MYSNRPRFIYVARGGPELSKVGVSINPKQRLDGVRWVATGGQVLKIETPEIPRIVWQKRYAAATARALERCIKHNLQHYRASVGNEWFVLSAAKAVDEVVSIIKRFPRCTNNQALDFIKTTAPLTRRVENDDA